MSRLSVSVALALATLLHPGPAAAQEPEPEPQPAPPPQPEPTPVPPPVHVQAVPATAAPNEAGTIERERRLAVGVDAVVVVPFGSLGDRTGVLLGPVLRFGYRVVPTVELLVKAGYLAGFSTRVGVSDLSLSVVPLSLGGRYFFFKDPRAGLYAGADVALDLLVPKVSVNGTSLEGLKSQTRLGANLGIGYVLGKELPIDFRAQFILLNLLLKEDSTISGATVSEQTLFGVGISVGGAISF